MFLFKLWIFNINFETIISFLIGLLFGVALVFLIYAVVVVASIGDKRFIIKTDDDSLTEANVKDLILEAQACYKDKKLRGKTGRITHCYKLSKDLAFGIAARFYPKSKYPLLEITVDEAIMLLGYIRKRIDEILGKRGLRIFRKLKLSLIADVSKKTSTVVNSRLFNISKNVSKSVNVIRRVISVINPVNLFRKTFVDTTLNIVTDKLCLIIITIVGEETYKIYSKKVLNKDVEIESNVDAIADSIDEEIINAKNRLEYAETNDDDYKFLTRYYEVISSDKKYNSIYDSDMKMKTGGN